MEGIGDCNGTDGSWEEHLGAALPVRGRRGAAHHGRVKLPVEATDEGSVEFGVDVLRISRSLAGSTNQPSPPSHHYLPTCLTCLPNIIYLTTYLHTYHLPK